MQEAVELLSNPENLETAARTLETAGDILFWYELAGISIGVGDGVLRKIRYTGQEYSELVEEEEGRLDYRDLRDFLTVVAYPNVAARNVTTLYIDKYLD